MNSSLKIIRGNQNNYSLGELLGQGQFGKVYRGTITSSNNQTVHQNSVAVKIIRKSKFLKNYKLKSLLERELKVLAQFKHPHVIQFQQLIIGTNDVYLIYQYCQGGTLQDRLTLTQSIFMPLLKQLIDALVIAEQLGIIHRDIKPANILFKQGQLKIADWGFSRLLESGQTTCSFIGSPAYMAPQVLQNQEYSFKADIWSLGVVIYEVLTGVCPWSANSVSSLHSQVMKASLIFPKTLDISPFLKSTISSMLTINAQLRPTAHSLQHNFNKYLHKQIISCIKPINNGAEQHLKIMSCIFFLQMIQWGRKQITDLDQLLLFTKLIEQNLLKIKISAKKQQMTNQVWEKQLRVVTELKRKIQCKLYKRESAKSKSLKTASDSVDNPEGQWQQIVKQTTKYVIEELQLVYKQLKHKKQAKLIELNIQLDLIVFSNMNQEYLKCSTDQYLKQLQNYNTKTLLKLINYKLILINKKYYQ